MIRPARAQPPGTLRPRALRPDAAVSPEPTGPESGRRGPSALPRARAPRAFPQRFSARSTTNFGSEATTSQPPKIRRSMTW